MKTNRERKMVAQIAGRGVMLAALLASMFSAAAICRAQASAAPSPNQGSKVAPGVAPATPVDSLSATPGANAVAASRPQATAAQGPRDAVTVHGYWVIDIRNADGTVAKHMEFENQLCTSSFSDGWGGGGVGGDSILSSLLQGSASVGAWSILVGIPDASGLAQPNCAIAPFAYSTQQSAFTSFIYGVGFSDHGIVSGPVFGLPVAMSCIFSNPFGISISFSGSNNITNHCNNPLTESPAPSGPGITLSAQFNQPTNVQISAVGTELFTCTGSPGPPRPADCLQIGPEAVNSLGLPNTPCTIQGTGATPNPLSSVTFTGCIPGDTTSSVTINSERVTNIPGRAPFSGVILTGINGVPGPFSIAPGQTAAVTWTLSFQ